MEAMIDAKIDYLKGTGQINAYRLLSSQKHCRLRGLPEIEGEMGWTGSQHLNEICYSNCLPVASCEAACYSKWQPIEALRTRLAWEKRDEENSQETGRSLLWYAAMADDFGAVQSLLKSIKLEDINRVLTNPDMQCGELAATPLMLAMAFARFEVVRELLDARADPTVRGQKGQNALHFAASAGNHANITSWLQHFCDKVYIDEENSFGGTPLISATTYPADMEEAVKVLISAGADSCTQNIFGLRPLHMNAWTNPNSEAVPGLVARMLISAGADINQRVEPSTPQMRRRLALARFKSHLGTKNVVTQAMSHKEGFTPLICAALGGKVELVKELLALKADPALCNKMGRTALDSARVFFGGLAPPLLEALLSTEALPEHRAS